MWQGWPTIHLHAGIPCHRLIGLGDVAGTSGLELFNVPYTTRAPTHAAHCVLTPKKCRRFRSPCTLTYPPTLGSFEGVPKLGFVGNKNKTCLSKGELNPNPDTPLAEPESPHDP